MTSDFLKVKDYLEKEIKDLTDKLKENSNLDTWGKLSEVCVTQLITFQQEEISWANNFAHRKIYWKEKICDKVESPNHANFVTNWKNFDAKGKFKSIYFMGLVSLF